MKVITGLMTVILFATLFTTNLFSQLDLDRSDQETLDRVKEKYLDDRGRMEIKYFSGNKVIKKKARLPYHVVVVRGDLTIRGEIEGSAVALFGDVRVKSSGCVDGDVISVDGCIDQSGNAWVKGDALEISSRSLKRRHSGYSNREIRRTRSYSRRSFRRDSRYRHGISFQNYWSVNELDNFILRYNRVEGGFIGFREPRDHYHNWRMGHLNLFGEIGYGFENKDLRYQIGGQLSTLSSLNLFLGGEYHDFTDTQDAWLVSESENSANALFVKKDFLDYYRRKGFSFFAVQEFTRDFKVKVEYRNDDYSNMLNMSNWSLFRGGHDFRLNPLINEGNMRSLIFSVNLDTRYDARVPESGWYLNGTAEFAGQVAGQELNGDFNFDRYIIDLRRYQTLSYSESLDFRLRVGSGRGNVPEQFLFDLGGISTLPGYHFKEFTGDRMVMFNSEYRTDGEFLFDDIWFLNLFHYILFANTGLAWFAQDTSSPLNFDNFEFSDLKTDVGIAIANRDGDMRVNFAHRLDGGGLNVSFRIHRNF